MDSTTAQASVGAKDVKLEGRELLAGDEPRSRIKPVLLAIAAVVLGVIVIGVILLFAMQMSGVSLFPTIVERSMITNKPILDKRQYEYAKFSNGLEVVSVYDEKTVSSGFSVAVEAGSFFDPKALPGLAHFCEHMVFLGTKKFPDATGFDNYLQMHGGYNNAYTSQEKTVYYAQLDKAGFEGGLDRFADFFRAPLFDKQYVQKEVHAIDSEHAKNKQSSQWRIMRIMNSLADPKSVVNGFSTGNLETLYTKPQAEGYDTVEELKKYYNANYCPPRLKLVTFGQESTSSQIETAFQKFSDIVSPEGCSATAPSFASPEPYPAERLKQFVHIKGVNPQGQLWLMFKMPDLTNKYKSHPASYLKYVLGYSGEHSLEQVLKEDLGLATGVSVDADSSSAGTKFWVVFELTPKGREHVQAVISTLFYYINLMHKNGVDLELYKSLGAIRQLQWDWQEASEITDTVMGMSETLTRMGKDDLLTGDTLIQEYDTNYTKTLLDLIVPSNMLAAFVDPKFDETREAKVFGQNCTELGCHYDHLPIKTDPYYEAQFVPMSLGDGMGKDAWLVDEWETWKYEDHADPSIDKKFAETYLAAIKKITTTMPEFKHPTEILHVPKNITLDFAKAPMGTDEMTRIYGEKPRLLSKKDETNKKTWYRQGSTSSSPKVNLKFVLRTKASPLTEETSIKEGLLFSIYQTMLQEQMEPKTVDLRATGISYSADANPHALTFGFGGFKNNLAEMIKQVMDGVGAGVTKDQKRFDRIVHELKDSLSDYSGMPVSYAMKDSKLLVNKGGHSNEEILEGLKAITVDDVVPVVSELKKKDFQLTTLVMGNIAEDEVAKLQSDFEKNVPVSMSVPMEEVRTIEPVINPGRRVEVRKLNPRKNDPNHVTTVTIQYGIPDIADSVKFGILSQVLRPAAYDELRTNQQLGYVVQGGVGLNSNVLQVSVMVQGDAKLPDEIEPQIDMVLNNIMTKKLNDMTDKEFEAYKASYSKDLLEPPLGFSEEIGHFWPVIARGNTCEDKLLQYLDYLRNQMTKKEQLIEAWQKLMLNGGKPRSRIVVKYFSDTLGVPATPSAEDYTLKLKALKVPDAAIQLTSDELATATVVTKVDSQARHQLLNSEGASYYPLEIKCGPQSKGETTPAGFAAHTSSFRKRGRQDSLETE